MSDADSLRPLHSESDWEAALAHSEDTPVLIYKHSSACPVSGQAHEEVEELTTDDTLPVYKVVVQEHRAISNQIEDDLSIRHETPQVILLHDRSPIYDTSHFDVSAATIRQELNRPPIATE